MSLLSQWWSLLSSWPRLPAGWCTCPRWAPAAAAGPAPRTDSPRPPPAWRTPSPGGPAGSPPCPETSSLLLGWWCSALHRTFLATDSSQGPGKDKSRFYSTMAFLFLVINWLDPASSAGAFPGLDCVHTALLFIRLQPVKGDRLRGDGNRPLGKKQTACLASFL